MKYEDLSFNMVNDSGLTVICDIECVIPNPNNEEEPYVIFTDYTLDDNDEFVKYYGRIVVENGEPKLRRVTDDYSINIINKLSEEETAKYVNDQVQDNLS